MSKSLPFILISVLIVSAASAADVRFTRGPVAARDGERVKITFAVSAKTDVEVAVLDSTGKVVRHLAAGVLGGKNPPPPPLRAGLKQALVWDGKDDFKKPAGGGPFKVRVRAGSGVKFGRLIGGDPYTFGSIVGIATDEDGNVYLLGFAGALNQRQMALRVFDPQGRYLREIMPFPADLRTDEMKDLARWDSEESTFRPTNRKNLNPDFYGAGRGATLQLVSASKKAGVVLTDGTKMYTLTTKGAVAGEKFLTKRMWDKKLVPYGSVPNSGRGPVYLALSPDGKRAYLSGPFTCKTKYGHKLNPKFPPGRVFHMAVAGGGKMGEFVTVPVPHHEGVGGNWTKGMGYASFTRSPVQGVTVDRAGRVYVCDRERERISVYDRDGKAVGNVPVKYPEQVAVHPASGAIYVMQKDRYEYGKWFAKLVRFDKLGAAAPAAEYEFGKNVRAPKMALSVSKGRTVVWVAGTRDRLTALADRGGAFEVIETKFKPVKGAQLDWNRLAVDYERDHVYVNDGTNIFYRYDGKTGKGGLLKSGGKPFWATDLAVGYDGLLYVRKGLGRRGGTDYSGPFERYTHDLKPAPYPQLGTHVLAKYIYSRYGIGYAERGIGHAPDGKVYLSWMFMGWVKYAVTGFGADGRPLKGKYLKGQGAADNYKRGTPKEMDSAIIGPVLGASGGIRVDLDGNIYVGMRVWPKDEPLPAKHEYEKDRAYSWTVGSVVKFGPEGGAVCSKGKWGSDPFGGQERTPGSKGIDTVVLPRKVKVFLEGAVAAYTGLAPFSHAGFGENSCCVCRVPRFDLDRFGRLALPNAVTNSVTVLDNAGNVVLEFGKYGNFDSRYVPAGATRPVVDTPAIPLTWPTGAGFTKEHIYVNDTYSRRVVRVDKTYDVDKIVKVE